MGRRFTQKQLVKCAILLSIDRNDNKEYIRGLLDMACYLGKISFDEKKELEAKAKIEIQDFDESYEI